MAGDDGVQAVRSRGVRLRLLEAAEDCLLRDGYAALSTRAVAEAAQTPLSQIHYHFGSKQGLVLALLEFQNEKLLHRHSELFAQDAPFSEHWRQACDYLEQDIRSGYVRVLHEIIAAGYSDPEVAGAAREALRGWFTLLPKLAEDFNAVLDGSDAISGAEVACLIGLAFLGAESLILIDMDLPILAALRAVGRVMKHFEQRKTGGQDAS